MPVDPKLRHLYSRKAGWFEVRDRIKARAGGTCECAGECGFRHSGGRCCAPHGQVVARWRAAPAIWSLDPEAMVSPDARRVRVVISVAHRNHNPHDNRDENLAALCQRCHLSHDAPHHHQTATRRLARLRRARGQHDLFPAQQLTLFRRCS